MRVLRFIKALWRWSIYGHYKTVSVRNYSHRLRSCCECWALDEENNTCKICGCKILIKAKWLTEECPRDLWEK